MIWSVAWKNIWRNKTRSLVILVAISLGLLAGIFSVGFMMGMVEERIQNSIDNEVSHIQVHNPEYLRNDEMEYTIENAEKLAQKVQTYSQVKAVASRIKINAMANTSGNNMGVTVFGVHPAQEKNVFNLHENIIAESGGYFNGETKNQVIIGEKLAEKLNVSQFEISDKTLSELKNEKVDKQIIHQLDSLKGKLFRSENDFKKAVNRVHGNRVSQKIYERIKEQSKVFRSRSKIVLTMQDANGNLTGGAFRIAGIYSISNSAYETANVFVRFDDLARLTNLNSESVHEIAILLNERNEAPQVMQKLKNDFPGMSVRLWKEIQPDLAVTTQYIEISYYVIIIFILLALGFGIVNTMLMAVLERIRELGMLMAIGMNRKRVFLMIMLETVYLTLTGAVVGMILGYLLIEITGSVGIDLSMYAEGFSAIGYSTLIYPEITFRFFAGVTALVAATGIFSSVYPAIKALKLNPVEATRTE
jgi:ABC-type lipoprotein release transport system permease subunit